MSDLIKGMLFVAGITVFVVLVGTICAILANILIDVYFDWWDRR